LPLGAEALLAFATGFGFFLALAALIPLRDHVVLVILWGTLAVYLTVRAAERFGPLFGVPLAIAAGLALDSFYIPPIRDFGSSTWQNWLVIAIYVALGVVIGAIAAHTERRRAASEKARASLAREQAALRRVATLVARQAPPADIFAVVAEEVGDVLGVPDTRLVRLADDGRNTVLADRGELNPATAISAPIVVDGRVWGAVLAGSQPNAPLEPETELRIEEFTKLVATAISNVQAKEDLAGSRARVVAAADEERRRVVRDLHDGAQQRLVHTVVTLNMARGAIEQGEDAALPLLDEALDQAKTAVQELRELAHGILPSVVTWGGLPAGVEALASRMPIPVELHVSLGRLDPAVEASAYFVVAEALTNVSKHANAQHAAVTAALQDGSLQLTIHDDGIGTADPNGRGLTGLADRLAALDGDLAVDSEPTRGTTLVATLPLRR
jgi:signal transduction histidine kinase